jgi:hypothetical protein
VTASSLGGLGAAAKLEGTLLEQLCDDFQVISI